MWFERLEHAMEEDKSLQIDATAKSLYINSVAAAVMGAAERDVSPNQYPSLELVILFLDRDFPEGEHMSNNWLLPIACTSVAGKWLKDNAQSKSAEIIKDQGLTAPLLVHANFSQKCIIHFLIKKEYLQKNHLLFYFSKKHDVSVTR